MTSLLPRRRHVLLGSGLALVAFVSASVFTAAPASAATLPVDESIITIGWNGVLSSPDPVTGVVTPGADTGIESITGLDVGNDGLGYAVNYDSDPAVLYVADLVAGTLTAPVTITDAEGGNISNCTGLDYNASGVIVAACDGPEISIGTIDPATGVYTTAIPLEDGARVAAVATDPITGETFGITYDGDVLRLDLESGTSEVVGNVGTMSIYGADFDSAGVLWAIAYDGGVNSLYSIQTGDWTATLESTLVDTPGIVFAEALTVWDQSAAAPIVPDPPVAPAEVAAPVAAPQATLANTGLDASALGLVGGLAVMIGLGALVSRRRSVSQR